MTLRAQVELIARFVGRSRSHFLFAGVGLVVGAATLTFFLALSSGIREKVLNRLYPVNQVELQVETVRLFGLGVEVPARIDEASLGALRGLPGVREVFPKQRSQFQARLWGGRDVFGQQARVEAFFDGIEARLLSLELRAAEREVLGPERSDTPCEADETCGIGSRCDDGLCARATWWNEFRDPGGVVACRNDDGCPPSMACIAARCEVACGDGCPASGTCVDGRCRRPCGSGEECDPGEVCLRGDGQGVCERLACRLADARTQLDDDWETLRGTVVGPVGATLPDRCPQGTYCAARNVLTPEGWCEAPIPVLISPFLLEVYNRIAATALGLRRLAGLEVVLGVRFAMMLGESYFVTDAPVERRVVRRCRMVGFTPKAMDFGVTMPLEAAVRANAMLKGRDVASEFTSVVVVTQRNEDVPSVVEDARVLGLTLAPRSEEARKAANVLLILTLVFAMVSLVILAISGINITHTFLMLVTERRGEIAVYRSIGATLRDIRILVLGEAAVLGILGGLLGVGIAWILSRAVNALAAGVLDRIPGGPDDLFAFTPLVLLIGAGCAVAAAIFGAWLPARAAARTDPATVLSQG
jgi:ABC-type lipoprotein release transport system permease subunit